MRPTIITLVSQHGQSASTMLQAGWNPLPSIHAGVWVYPTCLVIWNACPGAGELFLDHIEISFDSKVTGVLARSGWTANHSTLRIGSGNEYMAPRASMRVRWDYPTRCPDKAAYGPVQLKFAPSQKRQLFDGLKAQLPAVRDTRMWAPFGPRQPDSSGGELVGSLAGWEQDGAYFLLRHDLTMERMPIGRLNQQTGQPIRTIDMDYTTVRGWSKSVQLDEYVLPPVNAYQEDRQPRVTWPGTSPYRDLMLGKAQRGNSYLPYDAQHLSRALIPAKAAVQCNDAVARFDLDMIAADCEAAKMDTSSLPNGSRGLGWTIDAFAHSRATFGLARSLVDRMAAAQSPSGALLRAPYGYSFSPSPWEMSETIQVPIPKDVDVDAILERAICCHAAALDNDHQLIQRALAGMPFPSTKFVGVGRNQTEQFPTYQYPCGKGTWEIWVGIGAAAALAPRADWWHKYALSNPTPGGKVCKTLTELRDVLRTEKTGDDQTAVLACVLEEILP